MKREGMIGAFQVLLPRLNMFDVHALPFSSDVKQFIKENNFHQQALC
jgi:hypothetical protein